MIEGWANGIVKQTTLVMRYDLVDSVHRFGTQPPSVRTASTALLHPPSIITVLLTSSTAPVINADGIVRKHRHDAIQADLLC
jgi:hypothetical protein